MTLSLFIAPLAWYSKKSTIWSYDYDTFQPKIGQCGVGNPSMILLKALNYHALSLAESVRLNSGCTIA